jgi:hypothetical protein
VQELYVKDVLDSFPREFHKVFQRGMEGRHKNDDIMSSELEDASFDYYRRQIRSSIVGETDEDVEDVAAYKLGLDRPSARDLATTQHAIDYGLIEAPESEEGASLQEDPLVKKLMVERTPEEAASIRSWIKTLEAMEKRDANPIKAKTCRPRSAMGHAVATSFSAGLGLALGALSLRGVSFVIKTVRSQLNLGKKRGTKKLAVSSAAAHKKPPAASASTSKTAATATAQKASAKKPETKKPEAKKPEAKATSTTRTATKKR